MTTLVTGGCGFVGVNLAEALLLRGESVVLLDRRTPAFVKQALPDPSVTTLEGDVRDEAALSRVMHELRVDRVIHAAVITSGAVRESSEPGEIVSINVGGTVALLQAARASGCARILYVGSGSAYGRTLDGPGPVEEERSPSRPDTLYGITKLAAEQASLRLRQLWGLDVVCARLGTVFGPWERGTGVRDRLSPQLQLARLAVNGEAAILPVQEVRRDWIYSRDAAAGLTALLFAKDLRHSLYHVSAGGDWPGLFTDWCEELRAAYPKFSWRVANAGEAPNVTYHAERDRAAMDIRRITGDAGFTPRFGPREASEDYLAWILGHPTFVAAADSSHAPSSDEAPPSEGRVVHDRDLKSGSPP